MMEQQERDQLYKKAFDSWGEDLQVGMLYEEMAELTIAVNKRRRKHLTLEQGIASKEHITEEIADVRIMIEQLQWMLNIYSEDVEAQMERKLERLAERLR